MSQFDPLKSTNNFFESLQKQLQSFTLVYKLQQITVGAIFPVFEGFLASKASAENPSRIVITLLIVISILHTILLVLLVSTEKPLSQFLVEFSKQEEELEIQDEQIEVLDSYSHTFRNALNATSLSLVGLESIHRGQKQELKTVFRDILDPWIQSRSEIFHFHQGDAMYNIAVYLFNSDKKVLEVCFRQCDDRLKPTNRVWKEGVGHIGLCYAKDENVFSEDITKALQTTNLKIRRVEDKMYYKSVIVEPIRVEDQKKGVFIVSSSLPDQFSEEIHVPCVKVISQLLGLGYKSTVN